MLYKASRISFHCTVGPSVGTLDVFLFVAWLATVAKNLRPNIFLIRGTLCARRTKKHQTLLGGITSQDTSTYQSPQQIVGMCFPAIRRREGYPRTVLDRLSVHKKGDGLTLFLHFAMLRDPGWSSGSVSRKSRVDGHLRTNSRTFSGSPHLVQRRPY
jgi:hypothetical protein